jgi:hypothetical protein
MHYIPRNFIKRSMFTDATIFQTLNRLSVPECYFHMCFPPSEYVCTQDLSGSSRPLVSLNVDDRLEYRSPMWKAQCTGDRSIGRACRTGVVTTVRVLIGRYDFLLQLEEGMA